MESKKCQLGLVAPEAILASSKRYLDFRWLFAVCPSTFESGHSPPNAL